MINFKIKVLAIMLFTIVFANVNVFADSSNKVNKFMSVKEGDFNGEAFIEIMPLSKINMDDTIFITIKNADFYADLRDYQYNALGEENTYNFLKSKYEELEKEYSKENSGKDLAFILLFEPLITEYNSAKFPYKVKVVGKDKLEVKLFGITEDYVNEKFADAGKPIYHIPLPFTNARKGDITIKLDGNNTTIRQKYSAIIAVCSERQSDEFYYGDADGNDVININDASVLLKKILNNNYVLPIENMTVDFMKYVDLDGDGVLTAKDVALVLEKAIGK